VVGSTSATAWVPSPIVGGLFEAIGLRLRRTEVKFPPSSLATRDSSAADDEVWFIVSMVNSLT
jgi:hypothetical protein